MYKGKTVSVVIPTFNEKDSIRQCINDFFSTGFVDEIIVINNNAVAGTTEEVEKTSAKLVFEPKQGYGYGIQLGLATASSDFLVMCEPDGTFMPSDIEKLLAYTDMMDVVQGSRTSATHIVDGANMGIFLKYGNFLVAKIAQYLFPGASTSLSDCGCTFRLISQDAYQKIVPHFQCGGSAFGMEFSLLCLRARLRLCEIPVQYGPRVGKSSVTGNPWKTFKLGFTMIVMIFKHRLAEFATFF